MKYLRHLLFSFCLLATAATAADPAKTMFGVELGTRFTFPACARGEDALTKRHCYNATQTSRTAWGTDEQHVFYPRAEIVPYARGELTVEVVNGVIEAVHVHTWGIEAQSIAMDALKKRYGNPARSRAEKMKGLRSRFPVQYAEWDMKDYSVRFEGVINSVDWGRITLATNRYLQLVKTHAAAR
jgi:hypothetical protein